MDKRLESQASEFVLSLEQCIDYLERFYFLYQNNDVVLRLSNSAKASLLSQMREVMADDRFCETRRSVAFEALIMEFRSDKNWIDNLLANSISTTSFRFVQ